MEASIKRSSSGQCLTVPNGMQFSSCKMWVDKSWSDHLLAGLLRLLGQQNSLDVGQNTTLSDRDARQQLV